LCYIFAEDAPRIEGFRLPQGITKDWLTKRQCQIIHTNNLSVYVPSKFDESTLRRNRDPPLDRVQVKAKTNFIHYRASEFRRKQGIFLSRRCPHPATEALLNVMAKARKFSTDQWFFGISGDIKKRRLNFSPSIDSTLDAEEIAVLEDVVAPMYDLPKPQDVHRSYRESLEDYGVDLPEFDDWLKVNRTMRQLFFPEKSEKSKREDYARQSSPDRKKRLSKSEKKPAEKPRRKPCRPPKRANNELFVSNGDKDSTHSESSVEPPRKERRRQSKKRTERQRSPSEDSEKAPIVQPRKTETNKERPPIILPPLEMVDLTGVVRIAAQEHPTPAIPVETESQYRPFPQNARPPVTDPRTFQQPFHHWGTSPQDARNQT
jgi:hypothetical protein